MSFMVLGYLPITYKVGLTRARDYWWEKFIDGEVALTDYYSNPK